MPTPGNVYKDTGAGNAGYLYLVEYLRGHRIYFLCLGTGARGVEDDIGWNNCSMQELGKMPQVGDVYHSSLNGWDYVVTRVDADGTIHSHLANGNATSASSHPVEKWLSFMSNLTSPACASGSTMISSDTVWEIKATMPFEDRDAAERWCREHSLLFYSYTYPDTHPDKPGQTFWDVSGWCWPEDRQKDKVRICVIGKTLQEAAEKARGKFEEAKKL